MLIVRAVANLVAVVAAAALPVIFESVYAIVFLLDAEFVMNKLVPLNSTAPATGVVKFVPVINLNGAAVADPVGRVTVPVNVGLAVFAFAAIFGTSLWNAPNIVSVAATAVTLLSATKPVKTFPVTDASVIRLVANVPVVIFVASKTGISAAARSLEDTLVV